MLAWVTAPFSGLIILYIISKIDDYFKWKEVEKILIEQGESKEGIAKIKRLYMD